MDFVRGGRTMAPFVGKGFGSKTVERRGFVTRTLEPPLVAPDLVTTAELLLNRLPGENIYNAKSPEERAAEQLGKDLLESLMKWLTAVKNGCVHKSCLQGRLILLVKEWMTQFIFGLKRKEINHILN
ncbi:major capsid protein [Escherichia coli]|uniref:major capsid protein n=1 Tax=Escherichia coli TaxID=562 RepID=UPI004062DA9B